MTSTPPAARASGETVTMVAMPSDLRETMMEGDGELVRTMRFASLNEPGAGHVQLGTAVHATRREGAAR